MISADSKPVKLSIRIPLQNILTITCIWILLVIISYFSLDFVIFPQSVTGETVTQEELGGAKTHTATSGRWWTVYICDLMQICWLDKNMRKKLLYTVYWYKNGLKIYHHGTNMEVKVLSNWYMHISK